MTGYDRQHRDGHQSIIFGEMVRGPNGKGPFGKITEEGNREAGPAENAAGIFCPDVSATQFANVPAMAHAHEVITCGKATQDVGAQSDSAGLAPVSRLNLFHPQHSLCQVMSHLWLQDAPGV